MGNGISKETYMKIEDPALRDEMLLELQFDTYDTVVKLEKIENNILYISELDIINETPILDIKPYVPQFDNREKCRIGWLEDKIDNMYNTKDDGRFCL